MIRTNSLRLPGISGVKLVEMLLVLVVLATCITPAHGADGDVLRATLKNGLRVIIVRNTLAPVVATSVNYLVGSDEAPVGFPGIAHAQEHMMFRGTPAFQPINWPTSAVHGRQLQRQHPRKSHSVSLHRPRRVTLKSRCILRRSGCAGVHDSKQGWAHERGAIEQEVAQDLSDPAYMLYAKLAR